MDDGIESIMFKIMKNSKNNKDPLLRELEPDAESTVDWDFFIAHFLGFVITFFHFLGFVITFFFSKFYINVRQRICNYIDYFIFHHRTV